ncbi:putative RNA-directed DNA polymerase, partial [Tanacetum coccineum]
MTKPMSLRPPLSSPRERCDNAGNPLYLQPADHSNVPIVSFKLTQWERCNVVVLAWILGSLSQELYLGQVYSEMASKVWSELDETYDKIDGSVIFNLVHKINELKQGDLSMPKYYHTLNFLWREFDILTLLPACTCGAHERWLKHNQLVRLMQFLMGLNDVYQPVRSNLLAREPLPEVKDAFAIVSREESHRRLSPGKLSVKNSPTTFVVRTNNNNNKSNRRVSSNINNNRGPNPNFVCKHCDLIGHTINRCYEMNGYHVGFKRNPNLSKQSGSMKKFNGNVDVSQTTFTSSGSMPGSFTNDQMMKLLSLINKKPAANVSGNMPGIRPSFFNSNTYFNLHFEKFFCAKTNAYILKLIVGHPNGTMAKITTIGSLRLTDNVVLFDVLVVPEYNISLLSINKMIKDSKYFVGFDESKCYIQDLKLGKILGTGSESAGLYMFDCGDNGKSNVGDKIGFKIVDHSSACDIYHKANQTRESFSLSDHKSTGLGDLIHLDVWGPYRVVSRDGYKYFLISVDDYSRAVWVVRSDNGTGFVNSNMLNLFINSSIIHQTSCSYTPQQNGIAERKHRHLLNVARSLMFEGEILLSMWLECVLTATYLVNRLPSSVLSGASPFRLVYGKEPSLSHLRDFWCLCYSTVLNNSDKFGV